MNELTHPQPHPQNEHRPWRRRALVTLGAGLAAAAVAAPSGGAAQDLDAQLEDAQTELDSQRDQAGVLTSEIARYSDQIDELAARVAELRNQEAIVAERLAETQARLDAERERLARLQEELKASKVVLRERLVEIYKSDEPDALTVILSSEGFDDMVERYDYLKRIEDQDSQIVGRFAELREETVETVQSIRAARDEIAARKAELERTRAALEQQEAALDAARARKESALDSVQSHIHRLEGDVGAIQDRIQAQIQAAQEAAAEEAAAEAAAAEEAAAEEESSGGVAVPSGPVPGESSSGMVWPADGTLTSGFGYRWGRMHEGIDIAAPSGTPIRAASSGSVIQAGYSGGYGNYTCLDHGGGLSTCYAHQSSFAVGAGESVSQGEVIGYVGNTGSSTGDHLHFEVRVNGGAVDPMGYL